MHYVDALPWAGSGSLPTAWRSDWSSGSSRNYTGRYCEKNVFKSKAKLREPPKQVVTCDGGAADGVQLVSPLAASKRGCQGDAGAASGSADKPQKAKTQQVADSGSQDKSEKPKAAPPETTTLESLIKKTNNIKKTYSELETKADTLVKEIETDKNSAS